MLRNQRGFTLIEIIAVLVILGILAAVAVPRYMNLQDEARRQAAQGAIAELKGRASNLYAYHLLRSEPHECTDIASALATSLTASPLGDFDAETTSVCPAGIQLRVFEVKGVGVDPAVTSTWIYPNP